MKRFFQYFVLLFALVIVTFAPATVAYFVERSHWSLVEGVAKGLDKVSESQAEFIQAIQPLSNPEELERAKKIQGNFERIQKAIGGVISSFEGKVDTFNSLEGRVSFFLSHFARTHVGLYLHIGFFLATIAVMIWTYWLKRQVNSVLAAERDKMKAALRQYEKAAESIQWDLKRKIAELEGTLERKALVASEPSVTPRKAESQKQMAQVQESPASEKVQQKEWQFFLVANDSDEGKMAPNDEEGFAKALLGLGSEFMTMSRRLLRRKLHTAGRLSPPGRAEMMDKIKGGSKFQGWYKLRVGTFRVLLKFDDEQRTIRFFPATHEIYREIYRNRTKT